MRRSDCPLLGYCLAIDSYYESSAPEDLENVLRIFEIVLASEELKAAALICRSDNGSHCRFSPRYSKIKSETIMSALLQFDKS